MRGNWNGLFWKTLDWERRRGCEMPKGGEGRVRHHFIIKTILGINVLLCVYLLFYF
jgi:hypothetical protein